MNYGDCSGETKVSVLRDPTGRELRGCRHRPTALTAGAGPRLHQAAHGGAQEYAIFPANVASFRPAGNARTAHAGGPTGSRGSASERSRVRLRLWALRFSIGTGPRASAPSACSRDIEKLLQSSGATVSTSLIRGLPQVEHGCLTSSRDKRFGPARLAFVEAGPTARRSGRPMPLLMIGQNDLLSAIHSYRP